MYPDNGSSPLNLEGFKKCRLVLDVVYNPARTELLLQAEDLGIACKNGLSMLVAQAKAASELFTGEFNTG
jgi:shikimate dehydrogenase